jgi:hypothetical protein
MARDLEVRAYGITEDALPTLQETDTMTGP